MAANPKTVFEPRFCPGCGDPRPHGAKVDECQKCRPYVLRWSRESPLKLMKRRVQVNVLEHRMNLILPGDVDQLRKLGASEIKAKVQKPAAPRPPSELHTPTKPSLRVVRSKR